MQRPSYWLMADPLANHQFRRGWTMPPPLERKTPAASPAGEIFKGKSSTEIYGTDPAKAQALAEAEALFAPGGAP
jgi:hypothetical protein